LPAYPDDAHRPLGKQHQLEAILCRVKQRVVTNDYTFRFGAQIFQIERERARPRLRGAQARLEQRRSGEIAVRFESKYLPVRICDGSASAKPEKPNVAKPAKAIKPTRKNRWREASFKGPLRIWIEQSPSLMRPAKTKSNQKPGKLRPGLSSLLI
jgi:hypothetical protein